MRSFRSFLSCLGAVLLTIWPGALSAPADEVAFARHLALSPDGQTLAFSWAGDIWTVPIVGGSATRLTVHPAHDSHPVWSRDGQWLAFASARHGAANVFVMGRDGSGVRRLTFSDRSELPTDWSPDGASIYFYSGREGDVYREPRMYRVATAGGQSWRALDCFGTTPRVSPDGGRIAFVRGRTPWGRRGYRGSANYDIYVHTAATDTFKQLTDFDGTDRLPIWDAEGRGVYFLSDRAGTVNVWYQPVGDGTARQITHMSGDDVRDLAVSADGKTLAFTHWDRLYVMSPDDGQPQAIRVTAADDATRNDVELRAFTSGADEQEPSPDGEGIALVVHGEILVIKTEEKKPTRRVTDSVARDHDVVWSPDGKALFFVSDREGQEDIYRATSAEDPPEALSDSLRFKIERVTDDPAIEYSPQVSPDGKKLSYLRERGDLVIRDLKTGQESVLLESWNRPGYAWSPDSKWIAYQIEDLEHNSDVWVRPADGSRLPVNISRHPDYDGRPQWSADGQMLAFASQRHGFDSDLYLVFLSREVNEKSSVDLDEYFKKRSEAVKKRKPLKEAVASGKIVLAGEVPQTQPAETEPATKPAEEKPAKKPAGDLRSQLRRWLKDFLAEEDKKDKKPEKEKEEKKEYEYELETCYQRVRRVTSLLGDQSSFAFSPDGQLLAFTSAHADGRKLYTIKWNGEDVKSIVSAGVGALRWGLDGQKLYYLKSGVPNSCSSSGSGTKAHGFQTKMGISYAAEAAQKFADGARQLGLRFYHPTLKGLDWPGLTRKYNELALQTRTVTEFNEVFNMLQGELNGSHLGIHGPGRGRTEQLGNLGCTFDRTFAGHGLKVAAALKHSPADRAESRLVPGDIILKVNGQPVGPDSAIEKALINTVGDELIIEFIPSPEREPERQEDAPQTEEAEAPTEDEQAAEGARTAEEAAVDEPLTRQPTVKGEEDDETAASDEPAEDSEDESAGPRELVIRPVSSGSISGLQYRAWVEANTDYVEENSGGRVGYLHIRGMDRGSFEVFERDLYAAAQDKDGLIIDVRNNGGGWTADWVMAVLNVRRHAYTVQRGGEPGYPQDRLIFYAWTKPATMMCNQHSFSNAEIVSHAFKNLGRGPLVGVTTNGSVISTGAYRLIDGAMVRMPGRGWYVLPDGVDMELHGAEPDVKVPVTPADDVQGRRPQLDAAIQATLAQLAQ